MARQFILLPRNGLRAGFGSARSMLTDLPVTHSTDNPQSAMLPTASEREFQVLDTISEDGPKLVELDEESVDLTNAENSPLRAVPLVVYQQPNPKFATTVAAANGLTTFDVLVEDAVSGTPVSGVEVVAFSNFSASIGAQGTTDASGQASLSLHGAVIDRLYANPTPGYWGAFAQSLLIPAGGLVTISIQPVDLKYIDAVRHYYTASKFHTNSGVKIGIVDTGVGPHTDLNVVAGRNTVTGEPASDWQDPDGHGTHVAGLVGAQGTPPTGLRGMAPGVDLHAYRVFGSNLTDGATNYAILKALFFAAEDECDIVNLSLGGGPWDEIVQEAIADARNNGILVVAAAGNGGRRPVNFPAGHLGATAVSAMGHRHMFPAGSLDESTIQRPPYARDPNEFIAAFSNVGTKIDVTAPGVGVLSTLPNNKFGPNSGTSMAAPVVAGATACLLSRHPAIYAMPRDRARSDAIERILLMSCNRRGFGQVSEGYGMPDPALV